MNCLLRKTLLKAANKLLDDYKSDVDTARNKVQVWLGRAEAITKFLKSMSEKLADANLTEEELKAAVDELKYIVENWRAT